MPAHLHISVTFLQPTCHARLGKEEASPNEWPPSPLRLFQAMVAGAAARWANDDGSTRAALTARAPVEALKWLESLCAASPPTIFTPRATVGQAVPRHVPNNSADLVAAKWARGDALAKFDDRAKKVFRPTHLLDGPPHTVHYLWNLTDAQAIEARKHDKIIAAAVRSIVALGWGIDVAIGDARVIDDSETERLTGERWMPGRAGTPGLRLPVQGTLDALIDRHAKLLDRLKNGVFHPVPPLRAFGSTEYRRASDLPARPFAAFILRPLNRDTGYAAFAPTRAVCVAAMLRHATCEAAKADLDHRPDAWRTNEWALRFVAGHGPDGSPKRRDKNDMHPRFSYLPLPSIEHQHADGMIRRVIVAEPFGGDGRSARWASQRLTGAILHDEDQGPVARLEPVEPEEVEFTKVFRLYAARSHVESAAGWTSVTPVILPGYDDMKAAKRARILMKCLEHAGIDVATVESLKCRSTSWLARVPPSRGFKRAAYLHNLPAVHVYLRFHEPVQGPIAIGAGRHHGLGFFAMFE
ncbi:MAG TPA: type I-U CRISPR-associated protein Csb2 [Phycisphaerales bacterium]|nr:type I-U CRISPR-associated protein Csb2 [Phycisphaerales bacterium]